MGKVADRRYGLGGGLVTNVNPASLRDDELSDVRNFNLDVTGALITRGGQARVTTTPADSHTVTSGTRFYKRDGTKIDVFFRNQTMYKKSGTDGTSIDATAFTADTSFSYATFNNKLYYTNGTDTVSSQTMRVFDGSSTTAPSGSPATKCKSLIASVKMQRLLATNDGTDIVYGSALGNGEDWTTANDAFSINIRTDDGETNVGMVEISAGTLIFKASSIHLLTGTDPTTVSVVPISFDVGCTAPKSIATNHRSAFFLWNDRVYECDGKAAYPISNKITPTISGMTSLAGSVGVVYKERFRLYTTPSGGSSNTRCLEYYFNQPTKDGRRPWTQHDSQSVASAWTLHGDNGELYTGDYSGHLNQQESGTTDFGTAITAYADTGWQFLGEPERSKKFKRIWILTEPTGAYNLSVYVSYDGSSNTTVPETVDLTPSGAIWGSFLWGAATWGGTASFTEPDIRISNTAQSIKLRFQATSAAKVYGYTLINRKKRIR